MSVLEYFEALERLKSNTPKILSKNTKISNDSVALEAGRKRGSIKKSRPIFSQLIEAINIAADEQLLTQQGHTESVKKYKEKCANLQILYEKSLNREIMLIKRIYELERNIAELTSYRVQNINKIGNF